MTLADGRVLVVGGFDAVSDDDPVSTRVGLLATVEVWDPRTDRWESTGALPRGREGFGLVALEDGGALVVGGRIWRDHGRFATDRLERWDPDTGDRLAAAPMATAAAERAVVRLDDGTVLAVGGDRSALEADPDSTTDAYTSEAEIYDPDLDQWSTAPPLPTQIAHADAVQLADGPILVATGYDMLPHPGDTPSCPRPTDETWIFD